MAFSLTIGVDANYVHAVSDRQISNNQNLTSSPQLSKNTEQRDVVIKQITVTEKQIKKIKQSVSDNRGKLVESKERSEWMKEEISRLTKQITKREDIIKKRLRSMYINGGTVSYLDVLLGAESFGNFLDRLFALKVISENDNKLLSTQKNDKREQVSKRKALIKEQIKLQKGLEDLRKLEIVLLKKKEEQHSELVLLRKEASKIKEKEMSKKEETEITKAQKRTENNNVSLIETKKLSAAGQSNFINPTQGYISSEFGKRSFDNSFHPGIDIANSEGTPVKAAADGTVFRAYKSTSYGNTVMLSHKVNGKLYTTVYAHLNSYNVSTGERVTQGQVIGGMGNTGESFGSHLHFELYIGPWTPPPHKGAVNPVNYIQ
jgi:murein DD-endopeptidase MepM/ murein hydrolase activator NlpD